MNRAAAAVVAFGALVVGLFTRQRAQAAQQPAPLGPVASQDLGANLADQLGGWMNDALPDLAPQQLPQQDPQREARNVAAFLRMIYAAEGTAGEGGYGALFGWPRIAGRSFDPLTIGGHPQQFFSYTDKAGKTLRTSAAGAPQITYTTWTTYRPAFLAWAALNGKSTAGFLPATQDAFAEFLLWRDGALEHVKAGRLAQAIAIARGRWASLPGAGVDQPERSLSYVEAAYRQAGGTVA